MGCRQEDCVCSTAGLVFCASHGVHYTPVDSAPLPLDTDDDTPQLPPGMAALDTDTVVMVADIVCMHTHIASNGVRIAFRSSDDVVVRDVSLEEILRRIEMQRTLGSGSLAQ